mgnify:CR=1 FL=1
MSVKNRAIENLWKKAEAFAVEQGWISSAHRIASAIVAWEASKPKRRRKRAKK